LPPGLHLQLEFLFGLLQELQRQVLGGSAPSGLWACSFFSRRHLLGRLRQQLAIFLNDGSDTTRRLFMRSTRPLT
jgi:hypothetical protein